MKISVDGIYLPGNKTPIEGKQKECEDFILFGNLPIPHIILCDGCSSTYNSATGARILAHAAKKSLYNMIHVNRIMDIDYIGEEIIRRAQFVTETIGLNKDALAATLIMSFYWDRKIHTYIYGDGVYFAKSSKMSICSTINYDYESPYYLYYKIDPGAKYDYQLRLGSTELSVSFHEEISKFYSGGQDVERKTTNRRRAFNYNHHFIAEIKEFSIHMVTSDGVSRFVNKENTKRIPIEDMMDRLTKFKNTNGEFVKRRVLAEIKSLAKQGFDFYDDLAVACFLTEEDNAEGSDSGTNETDNTG